MPISAESTTLGYIVGLPSRTFLVGCHHLFRRAGAMSLCGRYSWLDVSRINEVKPGLWVCAECKGIAASEGQE